MTMVLEIPLDEEVMTFLRARCPDDLPIRVGSIGDRGVYRIEVSADTLETYNGLRDAGETASLSEFITALFRNGARGEYDEDLPPLPPRPTVTDIASTLPGNHVLVARTAPGRIITGCVASALLCEGGPFDGSRLPFLDLTKKKWVLSVGSESMVVEAAPDEIPVIPAQFAKHARWLGLYEAIENSETARWCSYVGETFSLTDSPLPVC